MDQLLSRIDMDVLKQVAPYAPAKKVGAQAAILHNLELVLPQLLAHAQINTVLRIAHFLAQICHESDGFCTLEEYASGAAYEGRKDLGNVKAGDGPRFKGRCPLQLTGRNNYGAFTRWMRKIDPNCPDFEAEPELVATWPWAGWAMIFFWEAKSINAVADRDDLVAVTKIVNGGRNGLEDRANCLKRAKLALGRMAGDALSAQQKFPVLVRGMSGETIERLQRALQAEGYYLLSIDGRFGSGTELAVKTFQRAKGLVVNGMVDEHTSTALKAYGFKAGA